ncbi:MAG: copper oxidase, partial [Lactobacillus helsingborgensis]|nr:copper oxidase [Lactobacillus helsingborgensis]
IEHEDAGMMAQIQIVDPKEPDKKYHLMDMETLTKAFAEERGVPEDEVFCPGMDVEGMAVKGEDHSLDALSSATHH